MPDQIFRSGLCGFCQLWNLEDPQDKKRDAQILGKADHIRLRHKALLRQRFGKLRWTRKAAERSQDGIDTP